jgi:hypothetical protein
MLPAEHVIRDEASQRPDWPEVEQLFGIFASSNLVASGTAMHVDIDNK